MGGFRVLCVSCVPIIKDELSTICVHIFVCVGFVY